MRTIKPSTLNPKTETLIPKLETFNFQLLTLNLKPKALNLQLGHPTPLSLNFTPGNRTRSAADFKPSTPDLTP